MYGPHAEGCMARRAGSTKTANPYGNGDALTFYFLEWLAGWKGEDDFQRRTAECRAS